MTVPADEAAMTPQIPRVDEVGEVMGTILPRAPPFDETAQGSNGFSVAMASHARAVRSVGSHDVG